MSDVRRRLARAVAGTQPSVRYVLGTVVSIDDDGCEVDLGDRIVDAIIASPIGGVAVDQGVRLSVQGGGTYTVESITDGNNWTEGGFSALSGWSLDVAQYRYDGARVSLAIRVSRTGSDITAGSTGNIADVDLISIPTSVVPADFPLGRIPFLWQSTTSSGGGHLTIATGVLSIDDMHPGNSVDTGDWVQITFTYPV